MKKLTRSETASVQRPRYHRRWERTESTQKEVQKKEQSLAGRLETDFRKILKKSDENETEASEDEEEADSEGFNPPEDFDIPAFIEDEPDPRADNLDSLQDY